MMRRILTKLNFVTALVLMISIAGFSVSSAFAADDENRDPDANGVYKEDGVYFDKDDNPVFHFDLKKDERTGKEVKVWDWLTYNGNRRYHAECHVCHGPLALGSTFAPALADSLKTMTYEQFRETVTNGRTVKQPDGSTAVMPTFGNNKNVMCFLDDFYNYLRARATGELGPITIQQMKKEKKAKSIREEEYSCFGFE